MVIVLEAEQHFKEGLVFVSRNVRDGVETGLGFSELDEFGYINKTSSCF